MMADSGASAKDSGESEREFEHAEKGSSLRAAACAKSIETDQNTGQRGRHRSFYKTEDPFSACSTRARIAAIFGAGNRNPHHHRNYKAVDLASKQVSWPVFLGDM